MRVGLFVCAGLALLVVGYLLGSSEQNKEPLSTSSTERPIFTFPGDTSQQSSGIELNLNDILGQPSAYDALTQTYSGLSRLSQTELETFVLDVAKLGSEAIFLKHELLLAGLRRLASIDPRATFEFVEATPEIANGSYLGIVLNNWGHLDPIGLVEYVKQLPAGPRQRRFAEHLVGNQLMKNAGLEYELDYLIPATADEIRYAKSIQLASPSEAFEIALAMPGHDRLTNSQAALSRWAEQNPIAAFQRVVEIQELNLKLTLMHKVFPQLVEADINQALAFLENEDNRYMLSNLVSYIAEKDIDTALRLVTSSKDHFGLAGVVANWGRREPEAALEYVDRRGVNDELARNLYSTIFSDYFVAEPEAALASWLERVEVNPMLATAMTSFLIDDANEGLVVRALQNTNQPIVQASLLERLTRYWSTQGPEAALAQLAEYKSNPGYQYALAEVASDIGRKSPERALSLIEPYLEEPMVRTHLGSILTNWHKQEPDKAAAWVESLETGPIKDEALTGIVQYYSFRDVEQAMRFVGQMSDSYRKDDSAMSIASQLVFFKKDMTEDDLIEALGVSGRMEQKIRDMKRQSDQARQKYNF